MHTISTSTERIQLVNNVEEKHSAPYGLVDHPNQVLSGDFPGEDLEGFSISATEDSCASPKPQRQGNQTKVGLFAFNEEKFLAIDRIEIANAISMIVPTLITYCMVYFSPHSLINQYCLALAWAPVIHFPFSFVYHFYMALPYPQEHWALFYHRLDAAFIHVVSSLYAYGTSCSLCYALLAAAFNTTIPITMLWRSESRVPNTKMILMSVILYVSPMLWNHAFLAFGATSLSFYIIVIVWEKKVFGSYYHSIMHVMMAIPQGLMISYALGLIS